jgi:phosphatidylinositol glycan class S
LVLLEQGYYWKAWILAKKALQLSESAFFDPTMVSMVYFPSEHKMAIYLPIFFPIGIPVIVALLKQSIRWKNKRQKIKAE